MTASENFITSETLKKLLTTEPPDKNVNTVDSGESSEDRIKRLSQEISSLLCFQIEGGDNMLTRINNEFVEFDKLREAEENFEATDKKLFKIRGIIEKFMRILTKKRSIFIPENAQFANKIEDSGMPWLSGDSENASEIKQHEKAALTEVFNKFLKNLELLELKMQARVAQTVSSEDFATVFGDQQN